MLSGTYQESSEENPKAAKSRPGQSTALEKNRRRLDFEAMRDTLLAVAGGIDLAVRRPSCGLDDRAVHARRTVYGFVERRIFRGCFAPSISPARTTTSPQRFSTTVPQQALS